MDSFLEDRGPAFCSVLKEAGALQNWQETASVSPKEMT